MRHGFADSILVWRSSDIERSDVRMQEARGSIMWNDVSLVEKNQCRW